MNLKQEREKMTELLKSKKALSPVIAMMILLAVTVAVSIAVAGWMRVLPFTFMRTEELDILSATYTTGNCTFTIYNSGTDQVTVDKIRIGSASPTDITDVPITAVSTEDVIVNQSWTSGVKYYYEIITTTGSVFPHIATPP